MRLLLRFVCAVAIAASAVLVAVPSAADEQIPVAQVVLHNVPKNSPFGARTVRVRIPTASEYHVADGITTMSSFRTERRVARSDGQQVYVKVRKKWVAVPYSYRGPGNALHFEESLRIVMGLQRDPLGARKPVYVARPAVSSGPTAAAALPPVPSSPRFVDDATVVARLGAGWRDEMLARVNELRAQVGAPPARMCQPLNDSATYKSQNMVTADYYGHEIPAGYPTVSEVAQASGGRAVYAENIAFNFRGVSDVTDAWRNSPGHYRNMTNANLVAMGFGAALDADGRFLWTQHFAADGAC